MKVKAISIAGIDTGGSGSELGLVDKVRGYNIMLYLYTRMRYIHMQYVLLMFGHINFHIHIGKRYTSSS